MNKLEFPLPKDDLCQVWLKLALWFLRRRFSNIAYVFLLLRNYLQSMALHLDKFESTFTHGCFVPSFVGTDQVVLEKKIFKISSMYICYFIIISPWKRAWPFI